MVLDVSGKRILLLQGPNGPFFRHLRDEFVAQGAEVDKVVFHAAEAFYFMGRPFLSFKGTLKEWPDHLSELTKRRRYHTCFLFGDSRPHHLAACQVLKELGVSVFALEDGYLRPDYITVERDGVNARSPLKVQPPQLQPPQLQAIQDRPPPAEPVEGAFGWSVLHTIINSLGVTLGAPIYPHYEHHRDVNTVRQALLWGRSGIRYCYFRHREKHLTGLFQGQLNKRYFLAGLQVFNDYQVKNSRFLDVAEFIEEVVASFVSHAPAEVSLVFKHHPADRAYREYGGMMLDLAKRHHLEGRLYYVHDLHLPTLLRHARGTVVINSTIGWSSLHHRTPVFALDETIYGYLGLAASGTLDEFWSSPPPVQGERVDAAEDWLRRNNQANGSVWTRLAGAGPAGIHWPKDLKL